MNICGKGGRGSRSSGPVCGLLSSYPTPTLFSVTADDKGLIGTSFLTADSKELRVRFALTADAKGFRSRNSSKVVEGTIQLSKSCGIFTQGRRYKPCNFHNTEFASTNPVTRGESVQLARKNSPIISPYRLVVNKIIIGLRYGSNG
jgi:hypothetical protein